MTSQPEPETAAARDPGGGTLGLDRCRAIPGHTGGRPPRGRGGAPRAGRLRPRHARSRRPRRPRGPVRERRPCSHPRRRSRRRTHADRFVPSSSLGSCGGGRDRARSGVGRNQIACRRRDPPRRGRRPRRRRHGGVCGAGRARALRAALGERLVVALDARAGRLALSGWDATAELRVDDAAVSCAPRPASARLHCTAVERDGTMAGPDLELLARVRGPLGTTGARGRAASAPSSRSRRSSRSSASRARRRPRVARGQRSRSRLRSVLARQP